MNFLNDTIQDDIQNTKKMIIDSAKIAIDGVKVRHQKSFDLLWNHKNPQAVLDSFNTSAAELFLVSSETCKFLSMMDTSYVAPIVPYEYTINEDGTVTVGDKITQD